MNNFLHKFQLIVGIALIGMAAGAPPDARAADLNIANSPLFVATNVEPNVMFTLDDSGSMQWEHHAGRGRHFHQLYLAAYGQQSVRGHRLRKSGA